MKYELLNFCEWDNKAAKIYSALHNCDASLNFGDITSVKNEDIPKCDVLFSGSPCQSVSNIGTRDGAEEDSGTKSSLMWHNLRFIKESNPKIVVWENVASMVRGKNKDNFERYCKAMEDLGYVNKWEILNPKDFGTPQNRPRMFFVSIRNDLDASKFSFPTPLNKSVNLFSYLEEFGNERYIVPHNCMVGMDNKTSIFRNRFLLKKPGDCGYCLTAKGGRAVITNNYIFNDWELYKKPPCELNDLHYLTENNIPIRALSPKEYWNLQDIPESYFNKAVEIGTSDAQLYIRAGNGINVKVAYLVFKKLTEAYPDVFEDFKYISLFSGIGCPEIALNMLCKEEN